MTNVKITELPALPVLADADLLAGVDDTDIITKKLTALQSHHWSPFRKASWVQISQGRQARREAGRRLKIPDKRDPL